MFVAASVKARVFSAINTLLSPAPTPQPLSPSPTASETYVPACRPPKPLVFLAQYYVPPHPQRRREIDECFYNNAQNRQWQHIVFLLERTADLPTLRSALREKATDPRIEYFQLGRKVRFSDIFNLCSGRLGFRDQVCVFANADIWFDDTVQWLAFVERGECAVISRHEPNPLRLVDCPQGTQDVWAFVPPAPAQLELETQFPPGHWHCENRVAYEMSRCGLRVCNPCHLVHAIHNHASNTGRPPMTVFTRGPYVIVKPSGIGQHASSPTPDHNADKLPDACPCSACRGRRPGIQDAYSPTFSLFDSDQARLHDIARTRFLQSLDLDWAGKKVLQIDVGPRGDIASWLESRGAHLTLIDASSDRITELIRRQPQYHCCAFVADLDVPGSLLDQKFDITVCFTGLNRSVQPQTVLERLRRRSTTLILESRVTASGEWNSETNASQVTHCPGIDFLRKQLSMLYKRIGETPQPDHLDFVVSTSSYQRVFLCREPVAVDQSTSQTLPACRDTADQPIPHTLLTLGQVMAVSAVSQCTECGSSVQQVNSLQLATATPADNQQPLLESATTVVEEKRNNRSRGDSAPVTNIGGWIVWNWDVRDKNQIAGCPQSLSAQI